MKKYRTAAGPALTAASREAAEALARDYGFGEIVSCEASPPRRSPKLRKIGVWCDRTQSWDVAPSPEYGAVAVQWETEQQDSSAAPAALGRDGGPRELTSAERRAFGAACEEAA